MPMNRDIKAIEPPPTTTWGRTFIYDGLAQTDIDMAFFRLINLDTTNLPVNQWLHDWDGINHIWTATQPRFQDIANFLTSDQQAHIQAVGIVRSGTWEATPLLPNRVPTLDAIRAPLNNLNLGAKRIVNLASPIDPGDAVNKGFMDFLLQGLNPKQAVRCATTSRRGLTGLPVIDGVQLVVGDRVLVKDDGTYLNGIWIAQAGSWLRATDADEADELERAYVTVLEGDDNIGTSWVQVAHILHSPPQPGDTVTWVLFSNNTANLNAGTGLTKDGNTINVNGTPNRIAVGEDNVDIDPLYTGQDSITTLGIVADGRWNAEVIAGEWGGTGAANTGRHIHLTLGDFSIATSAVPAYPDEPDATPGSSLTFRIRGTTDLVLPQHGVLATEDLLTKRVVSFTTFDKPAINTDTTDVYKLTSQDKSILSFSDNLTGTPKDAQELEIFIEEVHEFPPPPAPPDIPTVQSFPITWGNAFRDSPDLTLPDVTVGLAGMYLRFIFNTEHDKWFLINKVENLAL
jgi:hypothetical protein